VLVVVDLPRKRGHDRITSLRAVAAPTPQPLLMILEEDHGQEEAEAQEHDPG
jgi:hypothetical protein